MAIAEGGDGSCTHIYLLCLWRETGDAPWRASLRHAREEGRIPFPDLEALALYLLALPAELDRLAGDGGEKNGPVNDETTHGGTTRGTARTHDRRIDG